jgi:hypothetical protein
MSLRIAYRRVLGLIAYGLFKISPKSAVWGFWWGEEPHQAGFRRARRASPPDQVMSLSLSESGYGASVVSVDTLRYTPRHTKDTLIDTLIRLPGRTHRHTCIFQDTRMPSRTHPCSPRHTHMPSWAHSWTQMRLPGLI